MAATAERETLTVEETEGGTISLGGPQTGGTATPAVIEESKNLRDYHVFAGSIKNGTVTHVGTYKAHSDKSAVRKAVEEKGVGTYVAVVDSAWHEHTVTKKRVERVVFG